MNRGCVVALTVALGALAGCGAQAQLQPASSAAAGHRVRVGLTEWAVNLSAAAAEHGRITLVVTNAGATEHDLTVRGPRRTWHLPALDPGHRATLTVTAPSGATLALSSAVPGQLHPMRAVLPVR